MGHRCRQIRRVLTARSGALLGRSRSVRGVQSGSRGAGADGSTLYSQETRRLASIRLQTKSLFGDSGGTARTRAPMSASAWLYDR